VTGLLPEVVREGVRDQSIWSASQSLGVIAVVSLFVLLIEVQALQLAGRREHARVLSAVALPLAVVVLLNLASRIALLR